MSQSPKTVEEISWWSFNQKKKCFFFFKSLIWIENVAVDIYNPVDCIHLSPILVFHMMKDRNFLNVIAVARAHPAFTNCILNILLPAWWKFGAVAASEWTCSMLQNWLGKGWKQIRSLWKHWSNFISKSDIWGAWYWYWNR